MIEIVEKKEGVPLAFFPFKFLAVYYYYYFFRIYGFWRVDLIKGH